jgi:hypothetical protein
MVGKTTGQMAGAGPGLWVTDTEPASVDTVKLRAGRLSRVREMMREKDYAALRSLQPALRDGIEKHVRLLPA